MLKCCQWNRCSCAFAALERWNLPQEARECLRLDPEHKQCFPLYKKLKKVDKLLLQCEELSEARDFSGCIASANKVLQAEDEVPLVVFEAKKWLCSCSVKVAAGGGGGGAGRGVR